MSVKEQFYNQRPAVLFDPRASQRIDPRFKFTRNSTGTYVDASGVIRTAEANQPRFEFDAPTGALKGLLIEESRGNLFNASENFLDTGWGIHSNQRTITANVITAPNNTLTASLFVANSGYNYSANDGTILFNQVSLTGGIPYTWSIYAKAAGVNFISFRNNYTGAITSCNLTDEQTTSNKQYLGNGWYRCFVTYAPPFTSANGISWRPGGSPGVADGIGGFYIWGAQLEQGSSPTSYIPTSGSAVSRAADLLSVDTVSVPSTGSIYIDAQANSAAVNDTLLSIANSSDEKLLLQTQAPASLYNSRALVYAIDDTFEPTLPFPVPEPGDQRNIITWGDNNYHYQKSNYRKTPSLTASIPENLDRIGIGHDVTDPTKGFNGTLARLYLWANELPPEIARGLVRGNITVPLNADDGNVIPVAAHALIFNTQGNAFNGDKVVRFQLLGSNNSVSIDWNDGITETYAGSAANTTITHTYETPGLYLVTITGVFENIKLAGFTGSQASDLVNVAQNGPDWSPTNLTDLYNGCTLLKNEALDDFPATSLITQYVRAFQSCSSLTSFPLINTAAGTNFSEAWFGCSSLTSFPALDFDAAVGLASDASNTFTGFLTTWFDCFALADFPANLFDSTTCTRYLNAFANCALTAQSIENILVSINTANTSNGNLSLQGGTNAVKTSWTANANTAYDALVARGWTITFRP
jgi:hypothetical protein